MFGCEEQLVRRKEEKRRHGNTGTKRSGEQYDTFK